jgi:hypothetical protein
VGGRTNIIFYLPEDFIYSLQDVDEENNGDANTINSVRLIFYLFVNLLRRKNKYKIRKSKIKETKQTHKTKVSNFNSESITFYSYSLVNLDPKLLFIVSIDLKMRA